LRRISPHIGSGTVEWIANPGGATELGRVGVDTPYVASLPRKEPKE
jgi:hypothetical protein